MKTMKSFRDFSGDEKAALGMYGEEAHQIYKATNKLLRTGQVPGDTDGSMTKGAQYVSDHLKSGLDKLPDKQAVLHRGISGLTASNMKGLKVGDVIEDRGFGSWSTKHGAATKFMQGHGHSKAMMRLESKHAKDVSPMMQYKREEEHLTKPGTKMRLARITYDYDRVGRKDVPSYHFEEVE